MYANLVENSSRSSKMRNASSKSGLFPPTRAHSNNDARKMIFSNSQMQRLSSQYMQSSIAPSAGFGMVRRKFKMNIVSPNFRTVPHITSGNSNVLQRNKLSQEDIIRLQEAIDPYQNLMTINLSEIHELIDNMYLYLQSHSPNRSLNYLREIIRLCESITIKSASGQLSSIIPLIRSIYNSVIDEMKPLKKGRNSVGPERHDRLDMDFSGPANIGLEESKEYHHIMPIECEYGDSPTNAQDSREETKPGFEHRHDPKIDIAESDPVHPLVIHIDKEFLKKFDKK